MWGRGRRVGVRGVSDGPRVPLGVCWERRSQPGTCVDGWVSNGVSRGLMMIGTLAEVDSRAIQFIWRRLMTESTRRRGRRLTPTHRGREITARTTKAGRTRSPKPGA